MKLFNIPVISAAQLILLLTLTLLDLSLPFPSPVQDQNQLNPIPTPADPTSQQEGVKVKFNLSSTIPVLKAQVPITLQTRLLLPTTSHLNSRGTIPPQENLTIPSQSKSPLKSQSKSSHLPFKSQSTLIFGEKKKPHNSVVVVGKPGYPTINNILTNGRRQIGSRVNLHLQENGQGEGVNVTDGDSEFKTGSSLRRVSSIPLQYHARNTNTFGGGGGGEEPVVNVNSKSDDIKMVPQSFVIKGATSTLPGESSTPPPTLATSTQFSLGDNNKTETNRSVAWNLEVGERKSDDKASQDTSPKNTDTAEAKTDVGLEGDDKNSGGVGGVHVGVNARLYLKGGESGSGTKPCFSVIVSQQKTRVLDDTGTTPNDMDKWTRTLVKTSQCVANCMGRMEFMNKHNMSPKKGINELGGSASAAQRTSTIPVGISASSLVSNYNGDVTIPYNRFVDKLLSTCQRSCSAGNFLPQKSPQKTPISIHGWRQTQETNKANDLSSSPSPPLLSRSLSNHKEVSELTGKVTRNDKNSSGDVVDDANNAKNTIHLQLELQWTNKLGAKNKTPFTIYTVMLQEQQSNVTATDDDLDEERGRSLHWKLIDQTVAPHTQISLRVEAAETCQGESGESSGKIIIPREIMEDTTSPSKDVQDERRNFGAIRVKVLAVGSKGLEKVFSSLILLSPNKEKFPSTPPPTCCQPRIIVSETMIHHPTRKGNSIKPNLSPSLVAVIQNGNRNSGNVSNKINLEKPSTSTPTNSTPTSKEIVGGRRRKVSYKVESDLTTGQIATNEVKNANVDNNAPTTNSRTTNERDKVPMPGHFLQPKAKVQPWNWDLKITSMTYQNSLVVTQVLWNSPGGVSNQEKNAAGSSNNNRKSSSTTRSNNNDLVGGGIKAQRYQFLLTWEIFGGGLRGNLVTDNAFGNISLWRDTAYFIQVGLIEPDPEPGLSTDTNLPISGNLVTKEQEQEQHQNYMSNLLGGESIIFPLEPKVTLTSERLLVNTSQLSIQKSSPSQSPRTFGPTRRRSRVKSNNNPPWQGEPLALDEKPKYLENREGYYVSPISIPGGTVSTNGNEVGSPGHLQNGQRDQHYHVRDSLHKHNKKYPPNNQKSSYSGGGSTIHTIPGYLGDGPGTAGVKALRNDGEGESENLEKVHSHSLKHYLYSGGSSRKNSTTNYEDKTVDINDTKNNNLKHHHPPTDQHHQQQHQEQHHHHEHEGMSYKPEGYQGLFALNLGLGGYYEQDGSELEGVTTKSGNGSTTSKGSDTGASVIYSVFVLIVVACVIFLFLVAFIGFFVVTSSISQTAHYFIPKKLRIWVIGGNSESELLAGGVADNENDETEDNVVEGRFVEDLDEEGGLEWGEGGGGTGDHYHDVERAEDRCGFVELPQMT